MIVKFYFCLVIATLITIASSARANDNELANTILQNLHFDQTTLNKRDLARTAVSIEGDNPTTKRFNVYYRAETALPLKQAIKKTEDISSSLIANHYPLGFRVVGSTVTPIFSEDELYIEVATIVQIANLEEVIISDKSSSKLKFAYKLFTDHYHKQIDYISRSTKDSVGLGHTYNF